MKIIKKYPKIMFLYKIFIRKLRRNFFNTANPHRHTCFSGHNDRYGR